MYAPSQRQFNELDEEDGVDIREQINFEFNEEYENEHVGYTPELDHECDFYVEGASNHWNQNLSSNRDDPIPQFMTNFDKNPP